MYPLSIAFSAKDLHEPNLAKSTMFNINYGKSISYDKDLKLWMETAHTIVNRNLEKTSYTSSMTREPEKSF